MSLDYLYLPKKFVLLESYSREASHTQIFDHLLLYFFLRKFPPNNPIHLTIILFFYVTFLVNNIYNNAKKGNLLAFIDKQN